MRRCRATFSALAAALTATLCALLALTLATDTAAALPGAAAHASAPEADRATPEGDRAPQARTAPGTAAAEATVPTAGPVTTASSIRENRHPGPVEDCRHRRAIRATVVTAAPQPEPCEQCCAPAATVPAPHAPRAALHPACAATPAPGERPALLQVFRC